MKTFYLFRHGLATKSKYGYGKKIVTAEILPEGIPAIKRLGAHIAKENIDYAASSPFIRCRQTAAIVSEIIEKPFTYDERLQEFTLSSKEPFAQFISRVQSFVDDMKKSQYQHIAVCTHGAVIGLMLTILLEKKMYKKSVKEFPLTGVLTTINNKMLQTIDFNE